MHQLTIKSSKQEFIGQLCGSVANTISQAAWLLKIAKQLPSWLCSFSLKRKQHPLTAFTVIDQIRVRIPTYLNSPKWLSKPTHIALSQAWVSSTTPRFFFFFLALNVMQHSKLPNYFPLPLHSYCFPHSLSGNGLPKALQCNLSKPLNDHQNKIIM